MSWVGMFPGQGSQEPGMGMELLEKYPELLIDIFDDSLGWSLKDIINTGDAESIKKTNIAQPYIFAISYCYGLEAMKMENVITSPINGVVKKFNIKKGQPVNKGDVLVEIEFK